LVARDLRQLGPTNRRVEETALLIKKSPNLADGLHLRYSGDIPIKGKGSMVTYRYFVERYPLRDNTPQEELRHNDDQFFRVPGKNVKRR
jgi:hypothetical protein